MSFRGIVTLYHTGNYPDAMVTSKDTEKPLLKSLSEKFPNQIKMFESCKLLNSLKIQTEKQGNRNGLG
jgi:hypothetical protein